MKGYVRQKGKTWYYSFDVGKVNGKRKRIERVGGKTKKEAESALRNAISEYEKNNNTISLQSNKMTVAEYLKYWYNDYVLVNCKYNTQIYYRTLIDKHITPVFGGEKLTNITPTIIDNFFTIKSKSGISKSALQTLKATLSGAFNRAIHPYGFINKNPVKDIKLPKFQQTNSKLEEKLISGEEFEKIMERFNENTSFYIPLLIGYYTGARISEVFALTWNDIDFEEGFININKQIQKKGRHWYFESTKTFSSNRIIHVGESLIEILQKYKETQLLHRKNYDNFYNRNYEVSEGSVNTIQRRIVRADYSLKNVIGKELFFIATKENGDIITPESFKYASRIIRLELMINFKFKYFRSTQATLLLENGASLKSAQDRLGHSNAKTTLNIYNQITRNAQKDTAEIFEQHRKFSPKKTQK